MGSPQPHHRALPSPSPLCQAQKAVVNNLVLIEQLLSSDGDQK
jgi:hypothetical protein